MPEGLARGAGFTRDLLNFFTRPLEQRGLHEQDELHTLDSQALDQTARDEPRKSGNENCFVGKSQFSVRLLASSHNRFLVHNIVQRRSLRRARGVRQLHVIAYSRDARFARGQRA